MDAATGSSEFVTVSPALDLEGKGLSCSSAQCEIVGLYGVTGGGEDGFLVHGTPGAWTAGSAPLPANAQTGTTEFAALTGVDCSFDGGCEAVGWYEDTASHQRPLAESTSSTGTISGLEAPQPADKGSTSEAFLNYVSCLSSTHCTAVGSYFNNTSSNNVGMIDTLSGSSWSSQAAAVPSNAGSGANANSSLTTVA